MWLRWQIKCSFLPIIWQILNPQNCSQYVEIQGFYSLLNSLCFIAKTSLVSSKVKLPELRKSNSPGHCCWPSCLLHEIVLIQKNKKKSLIIFTWVIKQLEHNLTWSLQPLLLFLAGIVLLDLTTEWVCMCVFIFFSSLEQQHGWC